jgi:hypothetical protein
MVKMGKKKGAPKGNCNSVVHGAYMSLSRRHIDGRSTLSKQLQLLKREIISDLGGDVTRAQEILIDRIKFKCASLNFMELGISEGKTPLNEKYIALSNSLRADLQLIGLQRQEKKYVTLRGYLKDTAGSE